MIHSSDETNKKDEQWHHLSSGHICHTTMAVQTECMRSGNGIIGSPLGHCFYNRSHVRFVQCFKVASFLLTFNIRGNLALLEIVLMMQVSKETTRYVLSFSHRFP